MAFFYTTMKVMDDRMVAMETTMQADFEKFAAEKKRMLKQGRGNRQMSWGVG
ncbi:MAG: hypothetical protein J6M15_08320 [Prevotella sp.]|nr:hypothetical protein [Prevotella sp.]